VVAFEELPLDSHKGDLAVASGLWVAGLVKVAGGAFEIAQLVYNRLLVQLRLLEVAFEFGEDLNSSVYVLAGSAAERKCTHLFLAGAREVRYGVLLKLLGLSGT
jgi:hypothetical protein